MEADARLLLQGAGGKGSGGLFGPVFLFDLADDIGSPFQGGHDPVGLVAVSGLELLASPLGEFRQKRVLGNLWLGGSEIGGLGSVSLGFFVLVLLSPLALFRLRLLD